MKPGSPSEGSSHTTSSVSPVAELLEVEFPVFEHRTVMRAEVLRFLQPTPGGCYVDATVGGGGHAEAILEAVGPEGRLLAFDRDEVALEAAGHRLARFGTQVRLQYGYFSKVGEAVLEAGVSRVDGILADLGVSSPQLDKADRGFSFGQDGPLDMRMDRTRGITAADVVNDRPAEDLTRIFRELGEERYAARVARAIIRRRAQRPFERTVELAGLVASVMRGGGGARQRIHPATRVFQALRIEVNDELGELERGLRSAFARLAPGGRLVVIAFHSLEDRIVKRFFRELGSDCTCPPDLPICQCDKVAEGRLINRKPVMASAKEVAENPRSRSAKLRAVEKCRAGSR